MGYYVTTVGARTAVACVPTLEGAQLRARQESTRLLRDIEVWDAAGGLVYSVTRDGQARTRGWGAAALSAGAL